VYFRIIKFLHRTILKYRVKTYCLFVYPQNHTLIGLKLWNVAKFDKLESREVESNFISPRHFMRRQRKVITKMRGGAD